ncbi:MAG: transcription-repair coupling factor, partial [Phycisphaerales bacterium]
QVRGCTGSSTAFLSGALSLATERPVLLVVAHGDDADEAVDELTGAGLDAQRFPALETLPGESAVSVDLLAERLAVVQRLETPGSTPMPVFVAPMPALMQAVPSPGLLAALVLDLTSGSSPAGGPAGVVRWLDEAGYRRAAAVEEPGDYALRGGILDVFPPGEAIAASADLSAGGVPVRLDFFGDQIERVSEIDLRSMGTDRQVKATRFTAMSTDKLQSRSGQSDRCLVDLLPETCVALLHELMEITEQGRGYFERCTDTRGIFGPPAVFQRLRGRLKATVEVSQFSPFATGGEGESIDLPCQAAPSFSEDISKAVAELGALAVGGDGAPPLTVHVHCQNSGEHQRLGELLREFASETAALVRSTVGYLHAGFVHASPAPRAGPVLHLPYHDLLHRYQARRRARRLKAARTMDTFLEFEEGDYVVHVEHGIARFAGLRLIARSESLAGAGAKRAGDPEEQEEFLTLEFDGGAKLHVPAVKVALVQKYVGGFKGKPPLSTLGGQRWKGQKERVSQSVRDLAAELLRVRAAREHMPGIRYPDDTSWQREFEAEFPYTETEDQVAALAEIKKDMQSPRPMDRLLCGDVGFGKTELAIRAAFKCVEFGKQCAVLVPTTVLAEQHERTFRARFRDYPFRIESVSRFKSDGQVRAVLADLRAGRVDVIIGTHRLLSKDVVFADLGLVVIDEEQRFGVEHKERLLSLRLTADILTLSATPIPRTLHMAMLGIRDISSLTTAPLDRRAVVTEVIPFNAARLKQVLARELAREGQVYYVHNRVHDILSVADEVQKLAPGARIVVGHGQMPDGELEDVILRFVRREADILVSTTIIESGIDIPTANTMVICDADRFGLSELHQLRGRVGRYKHRAYCYLLQPVSRPIKEVALKRLKAIEQYSMLGAGFKIAMRDLEIRGAGNILGPEQSGHIASVGYDMYCQLLERAVRELGNEQVATPNETSVEIGLSGMIPRSHIPSDQRRLEAYRRLSLAASREDLAKVEQDLIGAYGAPPKPLRRLIDLAEIRIGARRAGVRTITVRDKDVILATDRPADVLMRFQDAKGTVTSLPPREAGGGGLHEVYFRPSSANALEPPTLSIILRKRLA